MKSPIPNAKPFKKGVSGNPKGRPKNPLGINQLPEIKELLTVALADETKGTSAAKRIVDIVIEKAEQGDLKAVEMLWDRRWGRPKQQMEFEGSVQTVNVEISQDEMKEIIQCFKNEL